MTAERRVFVDARREGQHGIARFGREVVTRMRTPMLRLGGPRDALSPLDLLNPHRLTLRPSDVVFSPGFHAGLTRARQLLTLHDLIQLEDKEERGRKKALYYQRIVRPAVLRAGRVLTVSETSRRAIDRWLRGAVPVIDVGNGCSDLFFSTPAAARRTGLLYVGALKPHKNPKVAFAGLAAVPDARMTVVTNDIDDAERLIAQYDVGKQVNLRTGVSDMELAGLYSSSAALVLPSLSEGFGLPAAEALAVGCPVIHWAGCAAVAEIVEGDGRSVGDADDVAEWARALAEGASGDLAAHGAERIRNRYSWAAVAARVDEEVVKLSS